MAWGRLSAAERLVVVGGFGVALLYLLGILLQSLAAQSSWLIAAAAGVVAGVVALLPAGRRAGWPVPAVVVVAGAALAAAGITIIEGLEMLFDLGDDLDDGGVLFVGVVALSAASGVVTEIGAERLGPPSISASGRAAVAGASVGARIALAGALVFVAGWVISVTIGVFALNFQTSIMVAAVAFGTACLLLGWSGGRVPLAWVVAGSGVIGGLVGLAILPDFVTEAVDVEAGLDLLWPFLLMLVGLAVFVVGSLLLVVDEQRRLPSVAT